MEDRFFDAGTQPKNRAGWLTAIVSAVIGGLITAYVLIPLMGPPLREPGAGGPGIPAPGSTATSPLNVSRGGNNLPTSQVAAVAETVGPAVVGVVNKMRVRDFFGRAIEEQGTGSGVIFDPSGYILTNNHVVEGATELIVSLADGRKVPARLVGADALADLAVIKIDAPNLKTAAFGDSDKLRVGDLAIAIGNPLGLEFQRTVTAGIISGLNRLVQVSEENSLQLIQTDATINPGNSGGPLLNAAGEVIGINTIKFSDRGRGVEGMGFAIPINTARTIVDDLVKYGRVVNRAFLGVLAVSREDAARFLDIEIPEGMLVYRITPDSPAAAAGIRQGDNILALDNVPVSNPADLRAVLRQKRPGDRIAVRVRRGGAEQQLTVTLGRAPER